MSRIGRAFFFAACAIAALLEGCATHPPDSAAGGRNSFLGFTDFSNFTAAPGRAPNETTFTSPEIQTPIPWDELITSWNATPESYVKVEARALFPGHDTKFYTLGLWCMDSSVYPRASVAGQRDADGTIKTDTLVLRQLANRVQVRVTVGGSSDKARLKFLGLSLSNTHARTRTGAPDTAAWGKSVSVPQLRQGEYEGGAGWCSPTCLSMALAYWSGILHRPELDCAVPDVAHGVYDIVYDGTGNWPFNTAFAGQFPGMRAYVTRFGDVSEIEKWTAAGVPVIASVSSYLARGSASGPDAGHLVVCVGFTEEGDIIVNDPGVSVKRNQPARKVYPRSRFVDAWKKSKNTVYLIYPESGPIPNDPLHHWAGQEGIFTANGRQ